MKVFQILGGITYWDATEQYPTFESTVGNFTPETLFVEAPDFVFEGWGYDPDASGDARFIKPIPQDGWLYDDKTGTFYPENGFKPDEKPSYNQLLTMYPAIERGMTT